jgi:hypothetical protein
MKTNTERIMWCRECSTVHVSNKKKKCCGADLAPMGFMERLVSAKKDNQSLETD